MLAACASGGDTFVRVKKAPPMIVQLKNDVLYKGIELAPAGSRYQMLLNDDGQFFVWKFLPERACPAHGLGACINVGLEIDKGTMCINGVAVLGDLASIFPLERNTRRDRRRDYSSTPCFELIQNN